MKVAGHYITWDGAKCGNVPFNYIYSLGNYMQMIDVRARENFGFFVTEIHISINFLGIKMTQHLYLLRS